MSYFRDNTKVTYQNDITVTSSSTKVLDINLERKSLQIQNHSGNDTVLLKFDTTHNGNEGIEIIQNGFYEPIKAPRNAIFLKSTGGDCRVTIIEGTDGST